jgi:hypothetical protein
MNARAEELFGALDVDAHAASRVFSVGHDQIDLLLLDQWWDESAHGAARGTSHHVTQNQHTNNARFDHLA